MGEGEGQTDSRQEEFPKPVARSKRSWGKMQMDFPNREKLPWQRNCHNSRQIMTKKPCKCWGKMGEVQSVKTSAKSSLHKLGMVVNLGTNNKGGNLMKWQTSLI